MVIAQIITDNREPFREYDKPQPWFGTAPAALLQGFAHLPDTQVHVLSCTQRRMAASPEKLAPNIWFHSLHVPKSGWLRTGYQGCIRAVRRALRELRPDIVHGQGTERECALSAVFSGFPNVLTLHGNMRLVEQINHPRPFTYGWLAARLEAFTLPRSRGVVCITGYTRQAVRDLARRTWLVPNAVNENYFNVARAPSARPLVLCVGNIIYRKNTNAFIRALDSLARRSEFTLRFVGSAPPGDAYAAEFFELIQSRPWCEHAGFTDHDALRRHFAGATLLALPSLEDNCPMVVLEAMAAGVPVAAANVGGVPDLVEDGVTGLMMNPTSADSMAAAVARLLADAPLRDRLALAAGERARQRFHPRVVAARHLEIYRDVLSFA